MYQNLTTPIFCLAALVVCVPFAIGNDDPEIPIDPGGGGIRELSYTIQPDWIHISTEEELPSVWKDFISTRYDILPDWQDLVLAGGVKNVSIGKKLKFEVRYDWHSSLHTMLEQMGMLTTTKMPDHVGRIIHRGWPGTFVVSLFSSEIRPTGRIGNTIWEHDFYTEYVLNPYVVHHAHHRLRHETIDVGGGKIHEISTNKIYLEFETWVPEVESAHENKLEIGQVSGFHIKKVTVKGEVDLGAYSLSNVRKGVFSFEDSWNLNIQGAPITYKVYPYKHDGVNWILDTSRDPLEFTID